MKPYIPVAISLAACLALPAAHAQTCQWKDAAGRTVVSDTPPPGNAKDVRCVGGSSLSGPAPTPTAAAASPKTLMEKDTDFKKRQQEGKEKADKAAKEQQAAADKKENCNRAKSTLAALESNQRVLAADEKGERRVMEDAERQQEIERNRRIVAESCN